MTVSTEALFDLAQGLQKDVRVVPNLVSAEMVQLAVSARAGTSFRRADARYGSSITT